jgi:hypothetical protein
MTPSESSRCTCWRGSTRERSASPRTSQCLAGLSPGVLVLVERWQPGVAPPPAPALRFSPTVLRAIAFLLTLALAMTLAACGNSGEPSATPATPAPGGNRWTFSGALSGVNTGVEPVCTETNGLRAIDATGALESGAFDLIFGAKGTGTFDYAKTGSGASPIELRYSPRVQPGNPYGWQAKAGDPGATGTLTIDSQSNGSLHVTLPPSPNSPGLADSITIDAQWVCP